MNIVVFDGYVNNPGDLSWDALKQYGTVTVYDRTQKADAPAHGNRPGLATGPACRSHRLFQAVQARAASGDFIPAGHSTSRILAAASAPTAGSVEGAAGDAPSAPLTEAC